MQLCKYYCDSGIIYKRIITIYVLGQRYATWGILAQMYLHFGWIFCLHHQGKYTLFYICLYNGGGRFIENKITRCHAPVTVAFTSVSETLDHHHHHISVMELVHLLPRSRLTYPEVSSKVYHDSFCQLRIGVSLSWVETLDIIRNAGLITRIPVLDSAAVFS